MKSEEKILSSFNLKLFSSCKQYENDFNHLVHGCNHGFSMGKSFCSFLCVIFIQDRIPGYAPCSHDVTDTPETCIAMLGNMSGSTLLSGLVDGRISTCKGNELLVSTEVLNSFLTINYKIGTHAVPRCFC